MANYDCESRLNRHIASHASRPNPTPLHHARTSPRPPQHRRLRRAVHPREPTFFDHLDSTKSLTSSGDPFHDHAHRMKPDIIVNGVVRQLGWQVAQDPKAPWHIKLAETTLAMLVDTIRSRLGAHAVRVVGDPSMRLTNVVLIPGAAGFPLHRMAMRDGWGQVLVVGEAREWETVEYFDDAIAAGQKKALILIGHIPSEQPGMEDATRWLEGLIREVPVKFVGAKDPFWGTR